MSARDVLETNIDPAVPADRARASIDAFRAEELAKAAHVVDARCEEYGVLGVGALLRRLIAEDGTEKTTPGAEVTPLTVFRAGYQGEGIPLGWYTTFDAAREHCEATLSSEHPAHVTVAFDWIGDPSEPLDPWELVATIGGGDEQPTGYVVTPIEVAAAYDPDAEQ